ncbi:MAG: MFS transporter [Gammaproteobacteria bacterium]|nr:MFS transporter [Pseudomonadales bacterium]MCP5345597.1 MFS transporter [Pseudomonadales bacterium]
MSTVTSLSDALRQLKDIRFLNILLLGFCSGFPWVLHGSVLTLWLQQSGLSRSAIGYVGAIATVYAINWVWAPFVDRIRLPWLYRWLGQRRSWIVLCQSVIVLAVISLSTTSPSNNLPLVSLLALLVAIASATLDIAVDAYRITIFHQDEMDEKMPYAAAVSTTGWWAGYGFIGGAIAVALGGESIGLAWSQVYQVIALMYLVLIALILKVSEPQAPPDDRDGLVAGESQRFELTQWLQSYVVQPFREFFNRCGLQLAVSVLLLLLVFRLGEGMLGRMSLVFYVEVGFSTDQISFYSKFFGGVVTAVFSLLAAALNTRFGVIRGLFFAGVAMAAANLLYALLAVVGPSGNLLMLTLLIDNFFQAFATVAFISFISYFTSRTYTGTQYALMASISNFGRTTLAAGSGAVVDFLNGDWSFFFILTTLMVIPGLCLLLWVSRLLKPFQERRANPGP